MRAFVRHFGRWFTMAASLLAAGRAPGAPGDTQASFDAPCRHPAGLASDGRHLYLLDWREARLFQIEPADGTVRKTLAAPTLKPQGLACGGGRLYVCDDHTGQVYALNPQTGLVEHTFAAPGEQAAGLAYAEGALFILESKTGKVYKVLPEDGTILGYFDAPDKACAAMTHDGKYLWISNRVKDEIYLVVPDTGMVIGILAAPGPYAAGLAWHDQHLWNVDFQTRKLYQLTVRGPPHYRLSDTRTARAEYLWALYNYGPADLRDLTVSVALPEDLPNQKLLSPPAFSCTGFTSPGEAGQSVTDRWGQVVRSFRLGELTAGHRVTVSYAVRAQLSAIRFLIFPEHTGTLSDIPVEIRAAYTADGSRYRLDSPFIQATVKTVVGEEKNPYWTARKIYNYVIAQLEYEMAGGWDIPEVVLKRGKGSCSEYTFTFIALCRAAGLPARYQGSVVVRGDDASVDEAFHRWAQIYLPDYGWVPVDASRGDAAGPADQVRGFGELANRFLITTQGGGDSEYLKWSYNSYAHYAATGFCRVEEDNLGFWEPVAPAEEQAAARPAEAASQPQGCRPLR